jgi:hypothetical protein
MADGCGRISEFSKVHRQRAHENQRIGMTLQLATAAHCFASTPTPFVSPYCSANCGTLLCPSTSIPHTAQMFFLWLKLFFFAQMFYHANARDIQSDFIYSGQYRTPLKWFFSGSNFFSLERAQCRNT